MLPENAVFPRLSGRTLQGQALLPLPEQASPLATPPVQASHIRMTVTSPGLGRRSENAPLPNCRSDDVYCTVRVSTFESLNARLPSWLQLGVNTTQSPSMVWSSSKAPFVRSAVTISHAWADLSMNAKPVAHVMAAARIFGKPTLRASARARDLHTDLIGVVCRRLDE